MSTLKVNKIIPTAGVPTGGGGGIIQVKQTQVTTASSTTSTSLVDTSLVVTMTPTSATSKILCMVDIKTSGTANSTYYRLVRVVGGTTYNVALGTAGVYDGFGGEHFATAYSNHYSTISNAVNTLDTAVSTAEHTYKVQWACRNGTAYLNRTGYSTTNSYYSNSACSNITLMEVSA